MQETIGEDVIAYNVASGGKPRVADENGSEAGGGDDQAQAVAPDALTHQDPDGPSHVPSADLDEAAPESTPVAAT